MLIYIHTYICIIHRVHVAYETVNITTTKNNNKQLYITFSEWVSFGYNRLVSLFTSSLKLYGDLVVYKYICIYTNFVYVHMYASNGLRTIPMLMLTKTSLPLRHSFGAHSVWVELSLLLSSSLSLSPSSRRHVVARLKLRLVACCLVEDNWIDGIGDYDIVDLAHRLFRGAIRFSYM